MNSIPDHTFYENQSLCRISGSPQKYSTLQEFRAGSSLYRSKGKKVFQKNTGRKIPDPWHAANEKLLSLLKQVCNEFKGLTGQLTGHSLIRERWTSLNTERTRLETIWGSFRGNDFWDITFSGSPGRTLQYRTGLWENWSVDLPACSEFKNYPVHFSPYCSTLLHEAVGHALEHEYLRDSPLLPNIGSRFCTDELTVMDHPEMPGLAGSMKYDDTGQPATETTLIHRGCLVGDLDSKKGVWRRGSFKSLPLIRATNFVIKKGSADPKDWLRFLPDQYYVAWINQGKWLPGTQYIAVHTGPVFRIRNGEPVGFFKSLKLEYHSVDFLKAIQAVGHDLQLDPMLHWCFKDGQGIPMSLISPSLLVDNCFQRSG